MTIDLTKMSMIELKAFVYDQLTQQDLLQANIRAANQLIAQRLQAEQAVIDAKHAGLNGRFAATEARNAALDAKLAADHKPE